MKESMNKLRVGVLMGGMSIEREVSFNSGRTVCDHLDTEKYEIIPIFQTVTNKLYILPWRFLHRGKISDFEHRLSKKAQGIIWDNLKQIIDFMYIATHGRYAEDGTLQGFLEILEIPYLGSKVFGSALGMDKVIQKVFLRAAGIFVPKDVWVKSYEIRKLHLEIIIKKIKTQLFSFPCIVKPYKEGSSLGISVVFHEEQLANALIQASTIHPSTYQDVLIEEYIEGMEFSCITLTDYTTGKPMPLPPTEVVKEKGTYLFDYNQKYMPGRALKFTPARCSDKQISMIQKTCVKTMQVLEFTNISRIDGFLTKDNRIVIVDPNSLSGMAPASFLFKEAAEKNMNHTNLINHLIETELITMGMNKFAKKSKKEKTVSANKKIRVAVLLGGASNEKEISLESGRNIIYKLSPYKYQAIPIFVNSKLELFRINNRILVCNTTSEIEERLEPSMQIRWHDLPLIADFVFIALHGGAGENGCVQGTLEMLNLPYNGSSVLTSALCMDKYKTCQFLAAQGFDVPQGLLVAKQQWKINRDATLANIIKTIGFPCIVKPHDDGCSFMVQKVTTKTNLEKALDLLMAQGKFVALIEEYILGTELTGAVIGNEKPQALPPSQTIAAQDILSIEEKFLPGAGENQTPALLTNKALTLVQQTLENVYQALNCKGYVRIDCFYQTKNQSPTGKERVIILEINSLPGLTPATCIFHQAAEIGIKPMEFIDLIVQYGFEEHDMKCNLVTKSDNITSKEISL